MGVTRPEHAPGLRLGRVLGVPVYIAPSWFLLAALLVLALSPPLVDSLGATQAYVVSGSFAVLLGLSVLLHEIGHCVVARAFDLPVRSITITFLAGFTEITKPPQTPGREYSVAVAGPMVSLLLAGVGITLRFQSAATRASDGVWMSALVTRLVSTRSICARSASFATR